MLLDILLIFFACLLEEIGGGCMCVSASANYTFSFFFFNSFDSVRNAMNWTAILIPLSVFIYLDEAFIKAAEFFFSLQLQKQNWRRIGRGQCALKTVWPSMNGLNYWTVCLLLLYQPNEHLLILVTVRISKFTYICLFVGSRISSFWCQSLAKPVALSIKANGEGPFLADAREMAFKEWITRSQKEGGKSFLPLPPRTHLFRILHKLLLRLSLSLIVS